MEYEFNCKPGKVDRRPCIISPYHYRLDWLMWFAAFQVIFYLIITCLGKFTPSISRKHAISHIIARTFQVKNSRGYFKFVCLNIFTIIKRYEHNPWLLSISAKFLKNDVNFTSQMISINPFEKSSKPPK